ncbi:hypothetical protein KSF73_14985 [Burkholderiaceae bacterium DAT-1]|nr:hypothetical protein [Burkholderiaceae bacterium DAT-1]
MPEAAQPTLDAEKMQETRNHPPQPPKVFKITDNQALISPESTAPARLALNQAIFPHDSTDGTGQRGEVEAQAVFGGALQVLEGDVSAHAVLHGEFSPASPKSAAQPCNGWAE